MASNSEKQPQATEDGIIIKPLRKDRSADQLSADVYHLMTSIGLFPEDIQSIMVCTEKQYAKVVMMEVARENLAYDSLTKDLKNIVECKRRDTYQGIYYPQEDEESAARRQMTDGNSASCPVLDGNLAKKESQPKGPEKASVGTEITESFTRLAELEDKIIMISEKTSTTVIEPCFFPDRKFYVLSETLTWPEKKQALEARINVDIIKNKSKLRDFVFKTGKNVCAFLNTADGAIYWGVDNSGKVIGIPIDHSSEDFLAQKIDMAINNCQPTVPISAYHVNFAKVINTSGCIEPNLCVLEVKVRGLSPVQFKYTYNNDEYIWTPEGAKLVTLKEDTATGGQSGPSSGGRSRQDSSRGGNRQDSSRGGNRQQVHANISSDKQAPARGGQTVPSSGSGNRQDSSRDVQAPSKSGQSGPISGGGNRQQVHDNIRSDTQASATGGQSGPNSGGGNRQQVQDVKISSDTQAPAIGGQSGPSSGGGNKQDNRRDVQASATSCQSGPSSGGGNRQQVHDNISSNTQAPATGGQSGPISGGGNRQDSSSNTHAPATIGQSGPNSGGGNRQQVQDDKISSDTQAPATSGQSGPISGGGNRQDNSSDAQAPATSGQTVPSSGGGNRQDNSSNAQAPATSGQTVPSSGGGNRQDSRRGGNRRGYNREAYRNENYRGGNRYHYNRDRQWNETYAYRDPYENYLYRHLNVYYESAPWNPYTWYR